MTKPKHRHVSGDKRGGRQLWYGVIAGVLLLVVLVQIFYPKDRTLLWARLNHESVAVASRDSIAITIQKAFESAKVTVRAGSASTKVSLASLGAVPNTDRMVDKMVDYPLWQRLIPFSLAVKYTAVDKLDVYFDQAQFEKSATMLSKKLHKAPTDARIAIKKEALMVTAAKSGSEVDSATLKGALSTTFFGFHNSTVVVAAKEIPPKKSDATIAEAKQKAEAIINKMITIKRPDGKVFKPNKQTLASWLLVKAGAKGAATLAIDDARLAAYVANLNDKLKVDPGVTTVNLVDGSEEARRAGHVGREINTEKLQADLKKLVLSREATGEATIEMRPVASVVVNNRRYTETQKGLQSYIDYVTSTEDVRISLVQLDGNRWRASARADETTPSGSTFKLYVALMLFDRLKKGEITWNDPILDTNVAGCFERMTVASTNPCAEAWIAQFGRQTLDNYIHSFGFSAGTTFVTNGTAVRTTAADLTKYMIGLHTGSLVSGEYRARLLDSLGRHPYRYGVPTGSKCAVHDKVGFLWDYVHDTAIVECPQGVYVVTIMTRGQSYARIAQITRELESIMYP